MKRFINPMSGALLAVMAFIFIKNMSRGNIGEWVLQEALMLPGIVIAISFHEYAHGIVAYKLGDMTPKFQNRLTVNPAAHIDPIGFFALLFVGFGWGRPVEINPRNFKNPRRDELLVSLAGVTMNFIIAIIFAFILKLFGSIAFTGGMLGYIYIIIYNIIYINIVLMIFNLLPVPPLDGFGIVTELFNLKQNEWYWTVYNNGFLILMILILFNITDRIIFPIIMGIMNVLF